MMPAATATAHTQNSTSTKRFSACGIAFILASGLAAAAEPPPNLARRVAEHERDSEAVRSNYTYRQTVVLEEIDTRGGALGQYREIRDIVFSPETGRSEKFVDGPQNLLKRLKLTEEDFRDLREVQPFLFTPDQLWLYRTRYRGEETVDGVDCWVMEIAPRQILDGQRLFEGLFWIHKQDLSVVRMEGRAVPQILRTKQENLFPRFTTFREKIDGKHWFPIHTHADDVLPFRAGPQRIRLSVKYSGYKRFGAESTVTFETSPAPDRK